jgi:6-pyruvoyl-tetrahydropterin synthase
MYAVEVRDHIMIAHSFRGDLFGPAQALHGATFVVDVAFFRDELTEDGVVIDIGRAHEVLKQTLGPLNYKNLDDVPEFAGRNTTTEFLAKHIFDALAGAARKNGFGPGSEGLARIRVTLHESHVARAWYEGSIERA